MKRKASMMLLSAVFLAALFCPHILYHAFSGEIDTANTENRTLAQKTDFSLKEIAAYPKAYEAYYNDHLPFRNQLIRLYNSLLYYGFGTSSNENVIVGKDGWLFYKNRADGLALECYTGSELLTQEELESIAHNLTHVRDTLAAEGIEFVLYIAPDKERVYSEYMPDYYGEQAEECMLTQLLSYLELHTDIRVVWPYEELMAYKEAHPQQLLYYKTDTHWNEIAGYIGTKALVKELGMDLPPLEEYHMRPVGTVSGDLADMLNRIGADEKVHMDISLDSQAAPRMIEHDGQGRVHYKQENAAGRKIFMRRDSFGLGMVPYLKYSFSEMVLMHYAKFKTEQLWEEKPDVFVVETVERYIRSLKYPIFEE